MSTSKFSLPGFIKIAPAVYLQDSQISGPLSNHYYSSTNPSLEDQQKNIFSGANPVFSIGGSSSVPPEPAAKSDDSPPPELIIIASWTGAQSRHVAKYTTAYNALFPGVPILVLTTVVSDMTMHSTAHKIKSLEPAVHYLLTRRLPSGPSPGRPFHSSPFNNSPRNASATSQSIPGGLLLPNSIINHSSLPTGGGNSGPFSSVLLHAFSEGGSYTSVALANLYLSSSPQQSSRIPISALVLDSTPGHRPTQTQARRAVAESLGPRISSYPLLAKPLSFAAVSCTTVALKMLDRYRTGKNNFDLTRRGLNDPALFELEGVPRLYLFSEKDEVVMWEDIQSHAEESGVRSLCVRFKGTRHCQHVTGKGREGRIYWEAVKSIWEMREDGGLGIKLMGLGGSADGGARGDTSRMDSETITGSGGMNGTDPWRRERFGRRRLSLDSLCQEE